MHTEGHVGSMFLAYAPFAFLLAVTGHLSYLLVGFAVLAMFPMVPDIDMKLPIKHRGWTHTVWFALALGALTAGVVSFAIVQFKPNFVLSEVYKPVLFGFFLGNMLVFGHLVGDAVTYMGIKPFYPFHDYKLRIDFKWVGLPTKASSSVANYLMGLVGVLALVGATVGGIYLRFGQLLFFF